MNRLIRVFALFLLATWLPALAQVNPCSLLTQSEIESALGVKLAGFGSGGQAGVTSICQGVVRNRMSVMVMFASGQNANDKKWADPLGELERQSRESANSIKAQMEVKRFGSSILCTTLVPPKPGPYSTQCMVVKKPTGMASVSVLVPAQQDMVSIDKLRPLAEKMGGRL